jgi:predicted lipid-binding transport protein (Tim44 family)
MKKLLLPTMFAAAALLSACGGATETTNTNSTAANANANRLANANRVDPIAAQTATPEATTNNAPTLNPIYKAYCAAWEKKDEKALRSIYSSDTIKDFERQMKEDNVRSLSEFLAEDNASTSLCEARNEKITGDTASAEVRTKGYPNGITVVFVKENGEWKLTNRRPEGALK